MQSFALTSTKEPRDATLDVRVSRRLKDRVEIAASRLGVERSVFVRETVERAARAVLEAERRHELSPEDVAMISAALDRPPAPTPAALKAASQYRNRVVHAD